MICQDIAPTLLELAGGKPGKHIQGRSLLPLFAGKRGGWRKSVLHEYWAENAYPWLVGMTYKAVRTERHKYIRWVNRSRNGELDELYDLDRDPYEIDNVIKQRRLPAGARQAAARAAAPDDRRAGSLVGLLRCSVIPKLSWTGNGPIKRRRRSCVHAELDIGRPALLRHRVRDDAPTGIIRPTPCAWSCRFRPAARPTS